MIEERDLTKDELRWCHRLQRVLTDKPRKLEIYVGMNNVVILDTGGRERCFEEGGKFKRSGSVEAIDEYCLFSFQADIEGDASGM